MTEKKPAKKTPAKRKPRPKKPVEVAVDPPVIDPVATVNRMTPDQIAEAVESLRRELIKKQEPQRPSLISRIAEDWRTHVLTLIAIAAAIVFFCRGWLPIEIDRRPVASDVLSQAFEADRISQVAVLRDLDAQKFDPTTDEGRKAATDWFNANRFRNRADDYRGYTDAMVQAFADGNLEELAKSIEVKK